MLTRERLDGLWAAQRNAPTTGGEKINLLKSETLGELLAAAEALANLRELDFHTDTFEEFGERAHELLEAIHMCGCWDDQTAVANSAPPTAEPRS